VISYSLYLTHAPIIAVVSRLIVYPLGLDRVPAFGLIVLLSLPLSVAAAHLFHLLFERPFARGFSPSAVREAFTKPTSLKVIED
jgi:peptidoglycan/LPS O-acetylase OafA/YrhL